MKNVTSSLIGSHDMGDPVNMPIPGSREAWQADLIGTKKASFAPHTSHDWDPARFRDGQIVGVETSDLHSGRAFFNTTRIGKGADCAHGSVQHTPCQPWHYHNWIPTALEPMLNAIKLRQAAPLSYQKFYW